MPPCSGAPAGNCLPDQLEEGQFQLEQTCTIDNFLTIMHFIFSEFPGVLGFFTRAQHGDVDVQRLCQALVEVHDNAKRGDWYQAKLTWLRFTGCDVEGEDNTINLLGDEDDMAFCWLKPLLKSWSADVCKCTGQNHTCFEGKWVLK